LPPANGMKYILIAATFLTCCTLGFAQTATNISVTAHNSQVFITWKNIPACDSGFYYVYKNTVPISDNITFQNSQYLGRVPFNFGLDFRLTSVLNDHEKHYLITNDTAMLDSTQNLFVMTCTSEGEKDYFAVRCDFGQTSPNWTVLANQNSTAGKVTQHVGQVKAYLQMNDVVFPNAPQGETMDIYIHYAGNTTTASYPAMDNEGCLPFHLGIIKSGNLGGMNTCFLKFHGGGGDFFNNTITVHIDSAWKISFDDWIPAFRIDSGGTNTRWFGYSQQFKVYEDDINTPPPISGIVRAYTVSRVNWELRWILNKWNTINYTTIDTSRMYLVGSSQGCAGVLLFSMLSPSRFASGSITVPKYNLLAPDDANPACRFNDNGSQVKQTRIFFGNEDSTNLYTDLPTSPGSSNFFKIYDITDMDYMFHFRKNTSLPFLSAINGKTDVITCWQEKIPFYDTVQATHCGGIWEWDLRGHSGTDSTSWSSLDVKSMRRFSCKKSYPAFSYTSLDNNPGSDTISTPPYYNGDNVGQLHASFDWLDSSIVDYSYLWQVRLFIRRNRQVDSTYVPTALPEFATTELTIRRAQQFKNFSAGTKLCWMNFYHGELIQSGVVSQLYQDTVALPVTVRGVKVFPEGNIFRIMRCDSIQPTGSLDDKNEMKSCMNTIYDSPMPGLLSVYNLIGKKISFGDFSSLTSVTEMTDEHPEVYFVRMLVEGIPVYFKWIKS